MEKTVECLLNGVTCTIFVLSVTFSLLKVGFCHFIPVFSHLIHRDVASESWFNGAASFSLVLIC